MNDKIFIVCVELNSRHATEQFNSIISSISLSYKKIVDNVYIIRANYTSTSEVIRDRIIAQFSGQCSVFVMKSSPDAAWRIPSDVDVWLKSII